MLNVDSPGKSTAVAVSPPVTLNIYYKVLSLLVQTMFPRISFFFFFFFGGEYDPLLQSMLGSG